MFISDVLNKMPNLNTVILRGCCSAAQKETIPKTCTVISRKSSIQTTPLKDNRTFLFQQTSNKTFLKYMDIDDNITVIELDNIPLNTETNKLSPDVEKALALSAKKNNLPPLSLPTLTEINAETKKAWRNNEPISAEDKKLLQATTPCTRTFKVQSFPADSLASLIDNELERIGVNVAIKGYGGPYKAYPLAGKIGDTSHGYQHAPKALKKFGK